MKAKKDKLKNFYYMILNVKIQGNKEATVEEYRNLFEKAFTKRMIVNCGKKYFVIMRQLVNQDRLPYVFGLLCRFTKLNNIVDTNKLELDNTKTTLSGKPINGEDTSFIFYPDLHRIAIRTGQPLSIKTSQKIFADILSSVIDDDKNVVVELEQSIDSFKKIISSKKIKKIIITVTPTNADINKNSIAFMDKELKKARLKKAYISLEALPNESIDISSGDVVGGLIGLSESNGTVSAYTETKEKKDKVLSTEHYPLEVKVTAKDAEKAREELYNKIKGLKNKKK